MVLKIDKLSFAYNKHEVLKNISFTAEYGEVVCVLGENGAGKSTLFRCILGLLSNYRGRILLDGKDIKSMQSLQLAKLLAYIPQSHFPAFNYSVLHVVLMGVTPHLKGYSSPGPEHERSAYEILEQLGICHLYNQGYAEISGGERQLVLIARALAQRSKILIMDEPTANLDYGNQVRVMLQIKNLAASGYLILLSTHNPEHALLFTDKVLVIKDQQIKWYGETNIILNEQTVEEIYGIPVHMEEIANGGSRMTVIVPKLVQPACDTGRQ